MQLFFTYLKLSLKLYKNFLKTIKKIKKSKDCVRRTRNYLETVDTNMNMKKKKLKISIIY